MQDMLEVLREKLGIDMLPETAHDLSEEYVCGHNIFNQLMLAQCISYIMN